MAINNPPLLASFDANQTNTQTLPSSQVTDGYAANEIPLSEHHGFMFNEFYKFLNHLKETGISQWDSTVSYSKHSRIMRDGVIYKSLSDANQGNDPLSTSLWLVDMWMNQTTTHNITTDSDYTLTADQNGFGRVVITDSGTVLTGSINIITDYVQKSFIAVNETLQDLTFKTSAGTGILVLAGTSTDLYNDGINVITRITNTQMGVGQTWQNLTGSRALDVTYTNTTNKPIMIGVRINSTSEVTPSITIGGTVMQFSVIPIGDAHVERIVVPIGETYILSVTDGAILNWHELR